MSSMMDEGFRRSNERLGAPLPASQASEVSKECPEGEGSRQVKDGHGTDLAAAVRPSLWPDRQTRGEMCLLPTDYV